MSNFTNFTSVMLPTINNPLYTLTDDLIYERYQEWSWIHIIAPKGTTTNFASLPWICTAFWDKDDPRWINAAILHDHLWSIAVTLKDYQDANDIFYEAMLVGKTPKSVAILFYLAVSLSKYLFYFYKKILF